MSYKCHICPKVFSHAVGLNVHFRSHFNQKCYICNICNKIFSKQCHLSKHLRSHKEKNLLTCDKCDKVFSHQIALNVHRQTHSKKGFLLCDVSIPDEDFLVDDEIENIDYSSMSDQYYEKNLNSTFSQNNKSFDNDMLPEKSSDLNVYQNNEESLECHGAQDVKIPLIHSVSQSRDIEYDLPQESSAANNFHNSNTSQKKSHLCNVYKSDFFSQSALDNHSCRPGDKEKFTCDKCQAQFSQKTVFYSHLLLHKRFRCKYCFKEFSNNDKYTYHIKTHEKPFKCIVCEKGFAQRMHLEDHLRTHTNEKPFECEECLATFSQRSHLNRHLHLHEEMDFFFERKSDNK